MDKNKLKVLQDINYTIQKCCGICEHATFQSNNTYFGTCSKHQYTHLKHTGPARDLSINRYGSCGSFSKHPYAMSASIESWYQFIRD